MQCPKREKVGILIWHIPPAVPLLTLDSAAFPGQHVWYLQPGQIPTEGSGHKCNFFFFLEKKTIPYKFLLNTGVFFKLRLLLFLWYLVISWAPDGNIFL